MRLPRWTVYPALVVLGGLCLTAFPRETRDDERGAALEARRAASGEPAVLPPARFERVVVLGIDGLDPEVLLETIDRYPDRMRAFTRLIEEGGLHMLGTSTPPQSPVAWSNFITGMDPGGHGIFDFIHRDPVTRKPAPGSVKVVAGSHVPLWGEWQFPIGGDTPSNRSGESFWVTLARHGVPADVWRMPANFPVEPAEGLSFPGMMTPTLDSAYGEYTIYTSDPPLETRKSGGRYEAVRPFDGTIFTNIQGPPNSFKRGDPHQRAPLTIHVDEEAGAIAIDTGVDALVLQPGQWSDFARVEFDLLPAGMVSISGIVRFYLRSIEPVFELYASPVNIDPSDPATPVSQPESASADLAEAIGLYYTQGMAEEVNALKDRAIDEEEFMQQTRLVYDERVRMMDYALDHYLASDAGGLFFFYFSTIDLNCHMMWRLRDEEHPHHADIAELAERDSSSWSGRTGSRWKEVISDLYMHMDPVLATLRRRIGDDALLIVMSDHGFKSYRRKFSLNTWLVEKGYLVLKEGSDREKPRDDPDFEKVYLWGAVDWSRTRAYGMGFNGLYLNLRGRELDDPSSAEDESGIVAPGAQADELVAELKRELEAVTDGGARVVLRADVTRDVYHGARMAEAPDIEVGYDAGYGNSDASSTGRIPHEVLADNLGGTFNGNHLMAPEVVPGTLLTNGVVLPGEHDLRDLTVEILRRYGVTPGASLTGHPVIE